MTQTTHSNSLEKAKLNPNSVGADIHERDRIVVRLSRGAGRPIIVRESQLTPSLLAELSRLGEFEDFEY